jgi:hypothetical protein
MAGATAGSHVFRVVRRLLVMSPVILVISAVTALALGTGLSSPSFDAMALMASAVGFITGDTAMRAMTARAGRA